MHYIVGFCMYNLKMFPGVILLDPAEAPPVLELKHKFPHGSPAFPLFRFYETTTDK